MKKKCLLVLLVFAAVFIAGQLAFAADKDAVDLSDKDTSQPVSSPSLGNNTTADQAADKAVEAKADDAQADSDVVDLSDKDTDLPVESPSLENATPAGQAPGKPVNKKDENKSDDEDTGDDE